MESTVSAHGAPRTGSVLDWEKLHQGARHSPQRPTEPDARCLRSAWCWASSFGRGATHARRVPPPPWGSLARVAPPRSRPEVGRFPAETGKCAGPPSAWPITFVTEIHIRVPDTPQSRQGRRSRSHSTCRRPGMRSRRAKGEDMTNQTLGPPVTRACGRRCALAAQGGDAQRFPLHAPAAACVTPGSRCSHGRALACTATPARHPC